MAAESGIKAKKELGLTKRGLAKHKTNPFLQDVADKTATRIRKVSDNSGEKMMVVSRETGELVGTSGFWHTQEVDRTQFVKLYINGVKAFKELSPAGTKVFELLYIQMQQNIGRDSIVLAFQEINQDINQISERTFFRGVRELIDKGFLAESLVACQYFVNPDYMWNGDRLAFVKEFRVKKANSKDTLTGDLFDPLAKIETTTPQEATAKRFADMANNYQNEKESGTPAHLIHPTPEPEKPPRI